MGQLGSRQIARVVTVSNTVPKDKLINTYVADKTEKLVNIFEENDKKELILSAENIHSVDDAAILKYKYKLECKSKPFAVGAYAELFSQRKLAIELFQYSTKDNFQQGEIFIGRHQKKPITIVLNGEKNCELEEITFELQAVKDFYSLKLELDGSDAEYEKLKKGMYSSDIFPLLAMRTSPFYNRRSDLNFNTERFSDVAILAAYHVRFNEIGPLLLHFIYFSHEDSKGSSKQATTFQEIHARTIDIEWSYALQFDKELNVIERSYQSGKKRNDPKWHGEHRFPVESSKKEKLMDKKSLGKYYLQNSSHPKLRVLGAKYLVPARHNVFGTHEMADDSTLVGHHPIPKFSLPMVSKTSMMARERPLIENPWTLDVSDNEHRTEGRRQHPSKKDFSHLSIWYVFVVLDYLEVKSDPIIPRFTLQILIDGEVVYEAPQEGFLDNYNILDNLFSLAETVPVFLEEDLSQKILEAIKEKKLSINITIVNKNKASKSKVMSIELVRILDDVYNVNGQLAHQSLYKQFPLQ